MCSLVKYSAWWIDPLSLKSFAFSTYLLGFDITSSYRAYSPVNHPYINVLEAPLSSPYLSDYEVESVVCDNQCSRSLP